MTPWTCFSLDLLGNNYSPIGFAWILLDLFPNFLEKCFQRKFSKNGAKLVIHLGLLIGILYFTGVFFVNTWGVS